MASRHPPQRLATSGEDAKRHPAFHFIPSFAGWHHPWLGVSSIVHKVQLGKAVLPSPSTVRLSSIPAVSSRSTRIALRTSYPPVGQLTFPNIPHRSQSFPVSGHRCQRHYSMIQLSPQTLGLIRISPLPILDHTRRYPPSRPAAASFLSPH